LFTCAKDLLVDANGGANAPVNGFAAINLSLWQSEW